MCVCVQVEHKTGLQIQPAWQENLLKAQRNMVKENVTEKWKWKDYN